MVKPKAHGEAHVKGAHLSGSQYFVVKVAGGFYGNASKGLPVGAGLMLAFSAATGRPEALLLDNGCLTDMRTGAAGAVAAKYLARKKLSQVALIGAGVQARYQLQALSCVRELPRVMVWSRTPERATAVVRDMTATLETDVQSVPRVEDAVRGSDLIVTVTPSRAPLVHADWLEPGAHITAVGSDTPDKQELEADVLRRADLIVADRIEQCRTSGEIHHALAQGAIRLGEIAGELGDVVIGRIPGRTSGEQITVCDLTGVGVQDAAAASLVLRDASHDLGTELNL
jgi:ornithine cyclodeaminase